MHNRTLNNPSPRFVRRTSLKPDEARVRFCQVDREAIEVVTSSEASRVTNLMSKVYLRLINAPSSCWERQGVLRFTGEEREGKWLTAWDQLLLVTGVASATAHKALAWLHEQGVIGYDAYRNGVGIRVFINLASSSIRQASSAREKILPSAPTSNQTSHTSSRETPFKDQNPKREIRDIKINPHAPQNGAAKHDCLIAATQNSVSGIQSAPLESTSLPPTLPMQDIIRLVKAELEPSFKSAALQVASREVAQTREWFESKALPKAVRIAQKESYNVLKSYGLIANTRRASVDVGRRLAVDNGISGAAKIIAPRSPAEVAELADSCLALLELQGRAIDDTLTEMNAEHGGWVLPEDITRVRACAEQQLRVDLKAKEH